MGEHNRRSKQGGKITLRKVKDNGKQTPKTCHQAEKYKDHDGQLHQFKFSCMQFMFAELMCSAHFMPLYLL